MTDEGNRTAEGQPIAGRVTEFVRVGDTVHRPATANTKSMRQLLVHLERSGFGGTPRVVGSEPDGALVLTWIDGWVRLRDEGVLDNQRQAAEHYRSPLLTTVLQGFTPMSLLTRRCRASHSPRTRSVA